MGRGEGGRVRIVEERRSPLLILDDGGPLTDHHPSGDVVWFSGGQS